MTIRSEIQLLEQSALLELFILDSTNLPNGEVMHFHAGTNKLLGSVVWQGQSYQPIPIEAGGFDMSTQGTAPRPRIKVANINGVLSAEVKKFDDFVGCKVIRKRTFAKYLDAANFPDGINPTADPNQFLADDVWYVERKIMETRYLIEFELSSAYDLVGVQLPTRQVIQNSCSWRYRSAECGYTGGWVDAYGYPTAIEANDICSKSLSACKGRFGSQPIRFGGYPGSTRSAK